jgi:hypothetical protein
MSWLALSLAALSLGAPERVGLFVGSNGAPRGREPLEHAEADARQMRRVFVELGGLPPEGAHLLEAPTAAAIKDAIATVGAGARLLVFYYSGHADARGLLLDGSELSFADLERALAATGAELRLELLDACRSGAMTRSKGARLGDRLQIAGGDRGEGRVVITSSAEWEDSHESDQLGGSFFTLHMTTGLRGAADSDRDGRVTLAEAYTYVYGRTVESTIGSGAGVQHPTFAYTLSGRGELVLTWPMKDGGTLVFGEGDYLVVDGASGRVAAEVVTPGARLSLPAGAYRVHKRTSDEVRSGWVHLTRGGTVVADPNLVEREAHARLVRKGRADDPGASHAIKLLGGVRGRVAAELDSAPLLRAGYELTVPWFSWMPYVSVTGSAELSTARLAWSSRELGLGVLLSRAIDFPWITLRGGLIGEVIHLIQTERDEREASRSAWGGVFAAQLALESPSLIGDLYATAAIEAALYVYPSTGATLEPVSQSEVVTRPSYRALFGLGYEF